MNEGVKGEQIASGYLLKQGYKILDKNFAAKTGEIDIIAEISNTIIFVEVKLRNSATFGTGVEAINNKKINKIKNTATVYMLKNNVKKSMRFDIVSIDKGKITHITGAF
jgi:putative endonuclease